MVRVATGTSRGCSGGRALGLAVLVSVVKSVVKVKHAVAIVRPCDPDLCADYDLQ